jgi:hypothetical protein
MALRPPAAFGGSDTIFDPIGVEIMSEKAASLGRAGEKVEKALAALRAHDGSSPDRAVHLRAAAQAVHAYFIQRELCGLRRHDDAIRDYGIPREVLVRLGAL